jgi:D-lactate dehydrogenase (cytochrome)
MYNLVPKRPDPAAVEQTITDLAAAFGNRLVTSRVVREQHGNTTTWIASQSPDAVIYPQSADDVQRAVRICISHRTPIIPFGTGT